MFTREFVKRINAQMIAGQDVFPVSPEAHAIIKRKTRQEITEALSKAWKEVKENAGRIKI